MDDDEDDQSNVNIAIPNKVFSLENLPAEFVAFLAKNEIDPAIYTVTDLPRYIRLNPDPHLTITPQELERQLGTRVEPVPGLEAFCRLDGSTKLKNVQAHKEGRIFGMDLSSGIAVYALDVQPGEHVLDICCAPGAKLCMIAGLLTNSGNVQSNRSQTSNQLHMDITGTVTGVDISPHRLSTCRALLKRHRLQQHARLFQADGTTFSVMRPSAIDTIRARIMAGTASSTPKHVNKPGHSSEPPQEPTTTASKRSLHDDDVDGDNGDDGGNEQERHAMDTLMETQAHNQFLAAGDNDVNDGSGQNSVKRHKLTLDMFSNLGSTLDKASTSSSSSDALFNGIETPISQEKLVPFFAPKILRNDPQLQSEAYKYDKVIVDAECTHDGSIAHILKYETWGWDNFHKNFMAQDRLDSLQDLQRGLLINGFRLAKRGGIVVYSTCSLSRAQNEDIVAWFLAKMRGRAVLEPLPKHALGIPTATCKRPSPTIIAEALGVQNLNVSLSNPSDTWHGTPSQEAEMAQFQNHIVDMCLRYDPLSSHTSGFFLARIRKLA
ncbi:hypothetical protein BGZ94_004815 [Podila epigama]|nr:hypothetical protein BGZ94_004815 [Podila epigama]